MNTNRGLNFNYIDVNYEDKEIERYDRDKDNNMSDELKKKYEEFIKEKEIKYEECKTKYDQFIYNMKLLKLFFNYLEEDNYPLEEITFLYFEYFVLKSEKIKIDNIISGDVKDYNQLKKVIPITIKILKDLIQNENMTGDRVELLKIYINKLEYY